MPSVACCSSHATLLHARKVLKRLEKGWTVRMNRKTKEGNKEQSKGFKRSQEQKKINKEHERGTHMRRLEVGLGWNQVGEKGWNCFFNVSTIQLNRNELSPRSTGLQVICPTYKGNLHLGRKEAAQTDKCVFTSAQARPSTKGPQLTFP